MKNLDFDFLVENVNNVVERPRTPNWRAENLCFESNYVMAFSLGGEASYTVRGKGSFTARANEVFLFPPDNVRSAKTDPKKLWHFISVNFNLTFLSGSRALFEDMLFHTSNIGEIVRQEFLTLLSVWGSKNPLYKTRSRTIVQNILCLLIREHLDRRYIPHQKQLEAAKKFIQENFTAKITIEEITAASNLSASHFRKLFGQTYGMSPMQYVTYLRINRARDLLASGEFNVSESAVLSGYDDVFYFSSLFKKKTGFTPSQIISGR